MPAIASSSVRCAPGRPAPGRPCPRGPGPALPATGAGGRRRPSRRAARSSLLLLSGHHGRAASSPLTLHASPQRLQSLLPVLAHRSVRDAEVVADLGQRAGLHHGLVHHPALAPRQGLEALPRPPPPLLLAAELL